MEFPNEFMCPISRQIMYDPVLCAGDGFTYEKECIEKWLKDHTKSPMTNLYLDNTGLIPNRAMKGMIRA